MLKTQPATTQDRTLLVTDEPEIDLVVAQFYAAFDNRDGCLPNVERLRTLFAPDARITKLTALQVEHWMPEAFIAPRATMLTDGTLTQFWEWEVESSTIRFNNIASRWSAYQKMGTLNGQRYEGSGHKLIHFRRKASDWLISSILWEDH
jgi:hypothetical protein